jgi:hypothetical protein
MGKGFIIKKKANNTPEIELTRIVVTEIHPNLKKAQSPKSSLAKEDNVLFSEHFSTETIHDHPSFFATVLITYRNFSVYQHFLPRCKPRHIY